MTEGMEYDSEIAEPAMQVLLIHGTFAYHGASEAREVGRWWQRDSLFCRTLQEKLGGRFVVAPRAMDVEDKFISDSVFHWSGDNSELGRRLAGGELLKRLKQREVAGVKYHIVAHSHGGGVLWEALQQAAASATNVDDPANVSEEERVLPHLMSWTTVGTPFLHVVPNPKCLWAIVPLVASCIVLIRQWQWLRDFWRSLLEFSGQPWYVPAFAILLVYAAVLFVPALLVRSVYRLRLLVAAQRDTRTSQDIPKREFLALIESVVATVGVASIVGLPWLSPQLSAIRDVAWNHAIIQSDVAVATLYEVIALLVLLVSTGILTVTVWRALQSRRRSRKAWSAWHHFKSRYGYFSCCDDEAINGLRVVQHGLPGPLLPRLTIPGSNDYDVATGRSRRPERGRGGWIRRAATLPIRIVFDWLLRPIYNNVFATLVDEFVLGRATSAAHGCDLLGLRLGFVSDAPIPPVNASFYGNWRLRDRISRWFTVARFNGKYGRNDIESHCLTDRQVCGWLRQRSEAAAPDFVSTFRKELGQEASIGLSIGDFFQRAMEGHGFESRLLLHTSYFDCQAFCYGIAKRIRASAGIGEPLFKFLPTAEVTNATEANGVSEAYETRSASNPWPPRDFAAWLTRAAVKTVLLASPALLLWAIGFLWLYPHSREYHLAWAHSPANPMGIVSDIQSNLQPSDRDDFTPGIVRWAAVAKMSRGHDALSNIEQSLSEGGLSSGWVAAFKAKVAQKLGEIERADLRDKLNREIRLMQITDGDSWSVAQRGIVKSAIDWSEHSTNLINERYARRIKEESSSGQPTLNVTTELTKAQLTQSLPCDSFVAIRWLARIAREIEPAAIDRRDWLTQAAQKQVRQILANEFDTSCVKRFEALQDVLTIHQRMLELEFPGTTCADQLLKDAREICASPMLLEDSFTATQKPHFGVKIESLVITAKSCRWPTTNRAIGIALLRVAVNIARESPDGEQQIRLLSRIACGFARLGAFTEASRLVADAKSRYKFAVAREMLCNELENNIVRESAKPAVELARVRQVLDELLNVKRDYTAIGRYELP